MLSIDLIKTLITTMKSNYFKEERKNSYRETSSFRNVIKDLSLFKHLRVLSNKSFKGF